MADAAVMQQLAPTGKLRVADRGRARALRAIRHQGRRRLQRRRGHARHRARRQARRSGRDRAHQASGEIQNSAADNKWDVAFLPVDEERKKFVDFGNAYHLLQSTFLVAPSSKINRSKTPTPRASASAASPTPRPSAPPSRRRPRPRISTLRASTAAVAAMNEGRSKPSRCRASCCPGWPARFPGARILPDAFLNSSTAVCVPKGKPAALAFVSDFIEEAKASGLVRRALDEMGSRPRRWPPPA